MSIQDTLLQRLIDQGKVEDDLALYVLAACDGGDALEQLIEGTSTPVRPASPADPSPAAAVPPTFLTCIQVRSFRGIGEEAALQVTPGPGVTLVVGRNGSGKSSFAEGAEVALTGTSARWVGKGSKEWQKGWRNVHSAPSPRIVVEMMQEGNAKQSRVERVWSDPEDLGSGQTTVIGPDKRRQPIASTGLAAALEQYRPFLSYSELGGMLEDGPGRIYQALLAGLGLDEYEKVRDLLASAENGRGKIVDAARKQAQALAARAREFAAAHPEESRFPEVAALLEKRVRDVGAIAALATARPADERSRTIDAIVAIAPPVDLQTADDLATELVSISEAQRAMRGHSADITLKLSEVLKRALALAAAARQDVCPVCGSDRALDAEWQADAQERLKELEAEAEAARQLRTRATATIRAAQQICGPVPDVLRRAAALQLPGAAEALARWESWAHGATLEDADALAQHLMAHATPLATTAAAAVQSAADEAAQRDVAWQPLALEIAQWVPGAIAAEHAKQAEKPLKEAKDWVAATIDAERQARFAPVKQQAIGFWNTIAHLSHVVLQDIVLSGMGKQQRVTLKVTVDGQDAPALGVLSQGELNAMTLSLFLPRVLLDATPFGFVIVDDPVQAMDEARVDGLARVLTEVGQQRQVVVFTHDARLPEAFDRLALPHSKRRVTRGLSSNVSVSLLVGPWEQRLEDAVSVTLTPDLPDHLAGRVVPGFCRQALEAACVDALRRRWLLRGDAHAEVEKRLTRRGLRELLAFLFFEDSTKHAALPARLKKLKVIDAVAIVQDCQSGAHEGFEGDLKEMVARTRALCEELRKVKAP